MITSRRHFLLGCSSAIAALAGSRLGLLSFANAGESTSLGDTLVVVFLRGGMDGLSLIPPIAGDDRVWYEEARPRLKIPLSGENAALPLDDRFGLHAAAQPLLPLFQDRKLAIIHAVGTSGSRSHFDAMKYLELGTPGVKSTASGWLTRHLQSSPGLPSTLNMPALATGNEVPNSLLASDEVINLADATTFALGRIGDPSWAGGDQWATLRRMYGGGSSFVHRAGIQALNAAGAVEGFLGGDYEPANGAEYPAQQIGQHFKMIARLIKNDSGLRVATVDYGGWDHHYNQGIQPGGQFHTRMGLLTSSLAAFYRDLDDSSASPLINRVTVVVVTEFGRRVRENANLGTDHGTANPVLVLGGGVLGGFHGTFPGLHPDQRFDNADLAPTNDLRRILSEILIRRTGNPRLGDVFPKYTGYSPMNIVSGPDLPPVYEASVPVTPSDFSAGRIPGGVRLTWSAAEHASQYRIERSLDGGEWRHLAVVGRESLSFDDITLPDGATPAYRLTAFNAAGEGQPVEAAPDVSGLEPLTEWRLRHFGTASDSGAAADDAVASSDGLPNFVKYALGLDPHIPADSDTTGFTPGKPRLETTGPSLVYVRPLNRPDVEYRVMASSDMKSWTHIPDASEGTAGGFERRRAHADQVGNHIFLKLDVRRVP